jgi:hypothetical protein
LGVEEIMAKAESKREQIENEITKLYNIFLKNKLRHSYLTDYHYDFASIYLQPDYICIEFKDEVSHLHIDYTGKVIGDVYTAYDINTLFTQLKLLKKLIVSII